MATTQKDTLITWLRDAHAMENHTIELLERQAGRLGEYPDFQRRVREHLEESRGQLRRIDDCLKALGSDSSSIKSGMASLMGNMQAMLNMMAGDEVVKGAMASYALEHFEIASYQVLKAAAEELNMAQVARVATDNLAEEERMQQWLLDHLPEITEQYLAREKRESVT
jgi:ferritin-like metal-binding protein YciE